MPGRFRYDLIPPGSRVLCALSGGMDSMYLLCRLLEGAEACGDGENVHCAQGSQEELEAAHHAGLPFGKYRAYLELQALDPSVTVEDVQGMSMAELRAWIAALSEGESQPQITPSGQTGQGWEGEAEHESGHGNGHGNGHGYGGPPW